jgi:hypothetical protein
MNYGKFLHFCGPVTGNDDVCMQLPFSYRTSPPSQLCFLPLLWLTNTPRRIRFIAQSYRCVVYERLEASTPTNRPANEPHFSRATNYSTLLLVFLTRLSLLPMATTVQTLSFSKTAMISLSHLICQLPQRRRCLHFHFARGNQFVSAGTRV